jgi:transitional endoplasmic reticulum ATPase
MSHGFVGADLQSIAKEAGIRALRNVLPEIDLTTENIPTEIMKKIVVTRADFLSVIKAMLYNTFVTILGCSYLC